MTWMLILLTLSGTPAADNPPQATLARVGLSYKECMKELKREAHRTNIPREAFACVVPVRK